VNAVAHPQPYTIADLYALPDDGMRHELYDGALLVSPPPRVHHHLAVSRLHGILSRALPETLEMLDNVGVRLGPARLLVPDLVIGPREALTQDELYLPASAVLLVVEVESPSSVAIDRTVKPALYAEAGIPWYLRIALDGEHGPKVHLYRLHGAVYADHAVATAGQMLTLDEPVAVAFDPAELTAR